VQFAEFAVDRFLRESWQKQPVLIRNPWAVWSNPLSPDELAGLACEPGIEARLIRQTRETWKAEHGPFPESRFGRPGKDPWTLLVQAVDHHVPAVAALIAPFRFVPNWRVDDVMVSYATDGGGVGPHFDQYDVFLIQGLGKRRWRVGATSDAASELLPHDDLRLLAHFEPTDEWLLEPGDILYVPPGVAHDGVAVGGDCMTYSIGFRAPARSEMIAHWCDHLLDGLEDDDRYADPDLQAQDNPGEIRGAAIARLHAMVTEKLLDLNGFTRWFGAYSSTRKYPDLDWAPDSPLTADQMRAQIADGALLCRNPASRFSFTRVPANTVLLFVDGECFECSEETAGFAERLCARDRMIIDRELARSDAAVELIAQLFNQGSVTFDQSD
jgi:50S ribosomal protein L16 3-hydroxylase